MPATGNPQHSWPAVATSEEILMRNILFAAIAALAVVFANLAAATAAPHIGDGKTLDQQSTLLQYSVAGG